MTLFVRPDFWGADACARVRSVMDRGRRVPAEIFRDGYIVDERVRRSYDVEVDSDTIAGVERSLADIRASVAAFFGTELTHTEGPGFFRYEPGGFYRAHRDRFEDRAETPRRVSVVLFLTTARRGSAEGCCEGGSLRVYGDEGEPIDIAPSAGTLVAFPAALLHEVLPVTAGVRDAIVDWFY